MALTKEEHTAFSNAIETGDCDTVEAMIGRYTELVNHPNWTPPPLHCAILWGQPAVAELLLDHGADIEMLDPDRQTTPLRYAIMYCKADVISLLLSKGANTGPIVEGGTSALQLATDCAGGGYEEYEDLPRPQEYAAVVTLLRRAGLTE